MNIEIHNYLSGSFLLEREPGEWDAIVILDSGLSATDFVAQHSRRHLFLRFDDIQTSHPGKRMPTRNDVADALDFATESSDLAVCCRAGQSRSAALAYLICHRKNGADAALGLLNPRRHIPNPFVVDLGMQLAEETTIADTFEEWQRTNRHIKLADNLDDIEREFRELQRQGARNRIVHGS